MARCWPTRAAGWVSASVRSAAGPGSGKRSSGESSRTSTPYAAATLRPGTYPRHRPGRGGNPSPLIQEYDATQRTAEEVTDLVVLHPAAPSGMRPHRRMAWITALGVAVLAILGWAGYHFVSAAGHTAGSTAIAAADRAPAHHQAGPGTPRPSPRPTPSPNPVAVAEHGRPGAQGGPGAGPDPGPRGGVRTRRHCPRRRSASCRARDRRHSPYGLAQRLVHHGGLREPAGGDRPAGGHGRAGDHHGRAGHARRAPRRGPSIARRECPRAGGPARGTPALRMRAEPSISAGRGGAPPYVLIWFTRLPPDASGTFQASVASVALQGQR